MSPKLKKMYEWKYFLIGSLAFFYNCGVLSRGYEEKVCKSHNFRQFVFCTFSELFLQVVGNGGAVMTKLEAGTPTIFFVGVQHYILDQSHMKYLQKSGALNVQFRHVLKMCIFWKFRKMSKSSVFKGLFQKWLTNCEPKP